MPLRPFWQSTLLGQSLVPLMGGTILVIGLAVIGSYMAKIENNRVTALVELENRANERAQLEQSVIIRVERQVRQCAAILARRLGEHKVASQPIPQLDDGTRRQLPQEQAPPLAVIVTGPSARDEVHIAAATCARNLLDELGNTLAEYPANLTIVVPGKWMATWGHDQVELVEVMLPNDPLLLPAEAANLEKADEFVWSQAFIEPATERRLVAATFSLDVPRIGRIAITQLLPIHEIMQRSVSADNELHKTVVFDQSGRVLAATGAKPSVLKPTSFITVEQLKDPVLRSVQSTIPVTGNMGEIVRDPITRGWFVVSRVPGPGWVMATYYSRQQIDAAAHSTAAWILGVGILVLCAQSLLLIVVLRSRVSRPLVQLTNAASAISADPKQLPTLDIKRQDEIGELSRHFTSMANTVAAREADLRQSNASLREREELSRAMIDSAADAVIVITDGVISEANPTAIELFAAQNSGLIGLDPKTLVHMRQLNSIDGIQEWDERSKSAADSQTQHFPLMMCRRIGDHFEAEIGLARVHLPGAQRLLAVIRDVTTRNLMERQLRQGQKLESLGQLAGGVAHDFNNMLAGIMGATELLSHDPKCDVGMQRHLGSILNTCDRAAGLTRKLLSFARKGQAQRQQVDLHQVIRDSAMMLHHSIDKRIEIILNLTAAPCTITGDSAQLQNAIINLALNARDAMPDGGKITISSRLTDIEVEDEPRLVVPIKPDTYLELSINDSGTGIPADVLPHIFEPFYTTKPVGKGTGLGLAAVYGMIMDHRGSLAVDSSTESGTTFYFYLPLSREGATSSFIEKVLENKPGRGVVLLVDDEDMVRSVGRQLLESIGFEVIEAANGVTAVDLFARNHQRIDVVLLDMEMPGMRGVDCLREIKVYRDNIPAVLCSGYARDITHDELREEGFHAQICKPYRLADLEQILEAAIHAGRTPS